MNGERILSQSVRRAVGWSDACTSSWSIDVFLSFILYVSISRSTTAIDDSWDACSFSAAAFFRLRASIYGVLDAWEVLWYQRTGKALRPWGQSLRHLLGSFSSSSSPLRRVSEGLSPLDLFTSPPPLIYLADLDYKSPAVSQIVWWSEMIKSSTVQPAMSGASPHELNFETGS